MKPPLGPDRPPDASALPARRRRRKQYKRHGFYALRTTLRELGPRVLDRRTGLGKQMAAWKADLIRDLGGDVSTQQAQLVDLCVKTKLLLDSIDAWLLVQSSLVNKRTRSLLPVVRERTALVTQLQSLLKDLGLKRRAKTSPAAAVLARIQEPVKPTSGE